MLFDPRPKTSREELYDREKELRALHEFARSGSPLMVVLGVRRVGKTSVVRVFLNEAGHPSIYIDARIFEEQGYSRETLLRAFSDALNRLRGRWVGLLEYLRAIDFVSVGGLGVRLRRGERAPTLARLLGALDSWAEENGETIIVAVDEAQMLRYLRGGKGRIDFTAIIAYGYDNLRHVKFVVTGSEVGVLTGFLGFDDPESPLYGRVWDELAIKGFSREQSLDFLRRGFSECGVSPPGRVLEEIVSLVDGIPGWLTFFGYKYCRNPDPSVVREIYRQAKSLALGELRRLPSKYYLLALKAISHGNRRWKTIKQAIELWIGHRITSAQASRILGALQRLSLIEKTGEGEYRIIDPVVAEAAKEL